MTNVLPRIALRSPLKDRNLRMNTLARKSLPARKHELKLIDLLIPLLHALMTGAPYFSRMIFHKIVKARPEYDRNHKHK